MRQLTTLPDEAAARRFAAWLLTQKIDAHAEKEKAGFAIWVRDEDRLPAAREQLAKFLEAPDDPRYRGAEQQANQMLQEEQQKRERAAKNIQDMSRKWGRGGVAAPKNCPLVIVMILASVLVGVLTSVGTSNPELIRQLKFGSGDAVKVNDEVAFIVAAPVWSSIQKGEVWRLLTPMFLHFGMMHLIFNMLWLYDFGGQIETRVKSLKFLALVVGVEIFASLVEIAVGAVWTGSIMFPTVGNFGGMSGVNYGLFGFLYIRNQRFNDRYVLHPTTIAIMFIWLFACMVWNQLPRDWVGKEAAHVANGAHVGGLLMGMALAYLPVFRK